MNSPIKAKSALIALPMALLACVTANAQIPVSGSTTAPTVTAVDQYFLGNAQSDSNNLGGDLVLNYAGTGVASAQNDGQTYIAGDQVSQGQTFTTGANSLGYDLNSITIRHVDYSVIVNNGSWWDIPDGATWGFAFGTYNGATLSQSYSATATYSGTALSNNGVANMGGTGTYLTFDLSSANLTLSPNTTYYFEIASTANPPYFETDGLQSGGYAGGTAFSGGTTASIDTIFNADTGDRTFVASLTAVPEPGTWVIMVVGLIGLTSLAGRRRPRASN